MARRRKRQRTGTPTTPVPADTTPEIEESAEPAVPITDVPTADAPTAEVPTAEAPSADAAPSAVTGEAPPEASIDPVVSEPVETVETVVPVEVSDPVVAESTEPAPPAVEPAPPAVATVETVETVVPVEVSDPVVAESTEPAPPAVEPAPPAVETVETVVPVEVSDPVVAESTEPALPAVEPVETVETVETVESVGEGDSAAPPAEPAEPAVAQAVVHPGPASDEVAPATDAGVEATPGGPVGRPVEGAAAWRRLLRMGLPRATKANLLGGLLAVLLGLAIATQVQLTQERGLSQLSQTDLIRVLDDVSSRSSRLDAQIRELEATRDRLKTGAGSSAEALAQAQKRADTLGILAGTVGATGPGVTITLSDPQQALTGPIILDLVQELRDAGAEAIEVGGVRVVASSFIGEIDGTITVDGTRISRPIRIKAIGDSKTLSSAMTIPGGIVETVRQKDASATVVEQDTVEITSLHEAREPRNATVVE